MTQTALAVPSLVRFQLTPASEQLEDRTRQRLERHERRRQGHLHRRWSPHQHPRSGRDALRGRGTPPQHVLPRGPDRLPRLGDLQPDRLKPGREARREPPASPIHGDPPAALPPSVPERLPAAAAAAIDAQPGLRRRARAPARASIRADEGRAGDAADDPADAGTARRLPCHRPQRHQPRQHRSADSEGSPR